jgi:hypothetical protein
MLPRTTLQRSRLYRLSEVSRALLAPMPPPTFSMMRYCANLLADHWNEMLGVEVQQVNWRRVIPPLQEIAAPS